MARFIHTPTNIDFIVDIYRDPATSHWILPAITYNRTQYYQPINPLNSDRNYQRHVVNHIYTRLSEKWLYKYPVYRSLLKYFRVVSDEDKVKVQLIDNIEDAKSSNISREDRKFVFRYIDRIFITRKFVRRVLKEYIGVTHINWFDLYQNTSTLKDLFAHKLKKLIIATIYDRD